MAIPKDYMKVGIDPLYGYAATRPVPFELLACIRTLLRP